MAANYDITYNVDMVFVIDTTGSMRPVLDLVKNNALNFYNDVTQKMSMKGKTAAPSKSSLTAWGE